MRPILVRTPPTETPPEAPPEALPPCILGIDPGLSGALAVIDIGPVSNCVVFDMPTLALSRGGKAKREINVHRLVGMIETAQPAHAYIEQIGAMPGQGVSSMFAMGKGYGIILGALAALGVPYTLVPPRLWKTSLRLSKDKDFSRSRASELLPAAAHQWSLKRHHGRAEAALIALWGARQWLSTPSSPSPIS